MHRMIIMAGAILASSIGFALAGLVLREAIKSCRGQPQSRQLDGFASARSDLEVRDLDLIRGYDTPELAREDLLARARETGSDRRIQ